MENDDVNISVEIVERKELIFVECEPNSNMHVNTWKESTRKLVRISRHLFSLSFSLFSLL